MYFVDPRPPLLPEAKHDVKHSGHVFYARPLGARIRTTHDLMDCRYLPERNRRPWARSRLFKDDYDDLHPEDRDTFDLSHEGVANDVQVDDSTAHRVSIVSLLSSAPFIMSTLSS